MVKYHAMVNLLPLILAITLGAQLVFPVAAHSAPQPLSQVKELNFVLLHGAATDDADLQLLGDSISDQALPFISTYETANPGVKVQVNLLRRTYPNDVSIEAWAANIASDIDKRFTGKQNLILVGHSMGGKAALYAVARDIGGLAKKTAVVATINSPIKRLNDYYVTGGGSAADYCGARWLGAGGGVCGSIGSYDSSLDGQWVATNKHWLAFISAESSPLSTQFDVGVDGYPRDMDDGFVPISAQYSTGADVFYYGEHAHGDFAHLAPVAGIVADALLRYVFGSDLEFSVLAGEGAFQHTAGWLPATYRWDEVFGERLIGSGSLTHVNESLFNVHEWEDTVGDSPSGSARGSFQVRLRDSLPFLTWVVESRWLDPTNTADSRLYIHTWTYPRTSVILDWSTFGQQLLPPRSKRNHYEIKVYDGTPLADVPQASWAGNDPRDVRLQVSSQAQGPFRWYHATWKVYTSETRQRKVIDEIPATPPN